MKIAILLTTYNRKEKTLACLERIEAQVLPSGYCLDVFLTDDASRDGTAEAVRQRFPQVKVLHGSGSLFWAGGMRHTWKAALKDPHDHYLLLNDDTLLSDTALYTLLRCPAGGIVIGATADPQGALSYGGRKLKPGMGWKGWNRWNSVPVRPHDSYVDCDFGNANIMLVPRQVVEKIGILSPVYTHGLADYDYSLKAKRAGFAVCLAPGFLGRCTDDHGNNWMGAGTKLRDRIAYLKSPKGLAYEEYLYFIRSHFPLSYPSAFIKLWMKTLFPMLWDRFKGSY